MQFQTIKVENPNGSSIILGEVHNLKTVQQIHQQLLQTFPRIQFGLTYIEASKPTVVKYSGTDEPLVHLARINACKIGAGGVFILFLSNDYPINAMEAIKRVPNISEIYCATSNPVEVIVNQNEKGRSLMGLVGDYSSEEAKKAWVDVKNF
ncbi:hypothetical protein IH970_05890 [candidate division KSB1 bacterium]|nr:hypothetical protein [candidate division KSB1 bacterium]